MGVELLLDVALDQVGGQGRLDRNGLGLGRGARAAAGSKQRLFLADGYAQEEDEDPQGQDAQEDSDELLGGELEFTRWFGHGFVPKLFFS